MNGLETQRIGETGRILRTRRDIDEARQRLLCLGPEALTDAELLQLAAGLESAGAAKSLLSHGLRTLLQTGADELSDDTRLGPQRAAQLQAAVELARRLTTRDDMRPRLATPQAIFDFARPLLMGQRRESLLVLCLNSRNVLVRWARVAQGSVDQCHIDPREALGPAISCRATAVVLVHNHPSGDVEPSVLDVTLTRQLREAARLFCIRLLDHLVVCDRGFVSMLTRGLLEDESAPLPNRLQSRRRG